MRIELHIGVEQCGSGRLQSVLAAARKDLLRDGVLFPRAPGDGNHSRLWMAITDPDHVDRLRHARGFISPDKQLALRQRLQADLLDAVAKHTPEVLILSASQLCWLASPTELIRLREFLAPLSETIRVTAHIDEQARVMSRLYATQLRDGRTASLHQEVSLAARANWWMDALKFAPDITPEKAQYMENQGAPFWLDYNQLVTHWGAEFGKDNIQLRAYDADQFATQAVGNELREAFKMSHAFTDIPEAPPPVSRSAATLTRMRQLNDLLCRLLAQGKHRLPRPLWQAFHDDVAVDGPPLSPGALKAISHCFAEQNAATIHKHSAISADTLHQPDPAADWEEANPTNGYRASQYLLAFKWRLDKAQKQAKAPKAVAPPLSDAARAILPPRAIENFAKLQGSPYAPHNRLGAVNEEDLAPAFTAAQPRALPEACSGNVIVGCMKNEAPYILEWVAYHRAIGVDNFLIYTNGCEDGTSEILDRLQEMGILQHRLNDDWKGNSPQQFALNRALDEPVIENADWVIHIDVDEFMNIRCGNGTLDDLFAQVPDATNIAMTWRLFGHNGVSALSDAFVIDQFDTCAPKFCPKPHTVWGFKTMFRNIDAYEKISCHRPNKLRDGMEEKVKWVNGSGRDMTRETLRNGWRNSKKSIGYDLIQLNHYALRSAESFLVKRQRGRALHVDRSIGLNYWIRMDWSDYRDITIKRNLPRLRTEYDRLLQDAPLRALHEAGIDWHRAKADELKKLPEFRELFDQAIALKLTETERVAYALALDTDT